MFEHVNTWSLIWLLSNCMKGSHSRTLSLGQSHVHAKTPLPWPTRVSGLEAIRRNLLQKPTYHNARCRLTHPTVCSFNYRSWVPWCTRGMLAGDNACSIWQQFRSGCYRLVVPLSFESEKGYTQFMRPARVNHNAWHSWMLFVILRLNEVFSAQQSVLLHFTTDQTVLQGYCLLQPGLAAIAHPGYVATVRHPIDDPKTRLAIAWPRTRGYGCIQWHIPFFWR